MRRGSHSSRNVHERPPSSQDPLYTSSNLQSVKGMSCKERTSGIQRRSVNRIPCPKLPQPLHRSTPSRHLRQTALNCPLSYMSPPNATTLRPCRSHMTRAGTPAFAHRNALLLRSAFPCSPNFRFRIQSLLIVHGFRLLEMCGCVLHKSTTASFWVV